MQAGTPMWQAAGFLGMTEEVLRDVYGHQHPDYMADACNAISSRQAPDKKQRTKAEQERPQNLYVLESKRNAG